MKFPPKKDVLLALLSEAWVFVQLDARAEGVDLPEWLKSDPAVVLQLGYDLPVPIVDLEIDDAGFRCTLSFRRTPHACKVPWKAVYRIYDTEGRGAIYIEDVPPELTSGVPPAASTPAAEAEAKPEPEPKPPTPAPGKKPRPPYLKLVK